MNHKLFLGFCIVGLLVAGLALHARAPKAETVSYKSGSDTVSGYLALPDGGGKHPAVLVIHEWWGLNDWAQEQTRRFAQQGYVALGVDLYRGKVAKDAEEAHELMRGLPDDRGLRDLEAAYAYLASRPDVNAEKIGSVGWCAGGSWSIKLAVDQPKLAACIVNYGWLPSEPANVEKIKAPVQGNFGAEDKGITVESVRAFESAMKGLGKPADIKIYAGAGHAFENPNNKDGYRAQDAADAWRRMTEFFKKTLQ
ncbi:MAG: dienelactone hydrolase family protein [Candidatus Acidiferrum sp.]